MKPQRRVIVYKMCLLEHSSAEWILAEDSVIFLLAALCSFPRNLRVAKPAKICSPTTQHTENISGMSEVCCNDGIFFIPYKYLEKVQRTVITAKVFTSVTSIRHLQGK